jgi:hypothetical protein
MREIRTRRRFACFVNLTRKLNRRVCVIFRLRNKQGKPLSLQVRKKYTYLIDIVPYFKLRVYIFCDVNYSFNYSDVKQGCLVASST